MISGNLLTKPGHNAQNRIGLCFVGEIAQSATRSGAKDPKLGKNLAH